MAVNVEGGTAAVGCSDHAAYVVDVRHAKLARTLFGKRVGHTEWVTGVTYVNDGSQRVATVGMDGRLVVWDAAARGGAGEPRCTVLEGHFGSVAAVASPAVGPHGGGMATPLGHLLVTAGYDKTVRVWDVTRGSGAGVAELRGHVAPVMQLALQPQVGAAPGLLAATGDRDGVVRVWDAGAGGADGSGCVGTLTGHRGHCTALTWLPPAVWSDGTPLPSTLPTHEYVVASGAQDGHVRIWDVRAKAPAANVEVHTTDGGAGAVAGIVATVAPTGGGGFETLLVTAGADRTVCVLDPRAGFGPRLRWDTHKDFIYSLEADGRTVLSGDGSGMLLAHDIVAGGPVWGLGANEAAVRCIGVLPGALVVSGDDGKALVYDFPPAAG